MKKVTLNLPDELAEQAMRAGLLQPDALAELLRAAIRDRRRGRLLELMDTLAAVTPQLSEAEIDAEVEAARAERAGRR